MPHYQQLGDIPAKRHTQFRKPDGSLYKEELMGTRGFSGIQSILYHLHEPTRVKTSKVLRKAPVELAENLPLEPHLLDTSSFLSSGDAISGRVWLMANSSARIGLVTPDAEQQFFYKNAACDELYFVDSGSGDLLTQFGKLSWSAGDYIIIPVGTIFQFRCTASSKLLVVESDGPIEVPRRYRNEYGQFNEFAPFCERDIRTPEFVAAHDQLGEFELQIKVGPTLNSLTLDHHPFDVAGWDGYLYPWIFNIADFEPITGRIHQPPPVHQTFTAPGFVVCSFVPRMYDYHPQAIPVPYNHSNVNSDEVLYYVKGDFMSRKSLKLGSFTHHPAGIPHGPHPGAVESSLGKSATNELAVMIDTFAPLGLTNEALKYVDPRYLTSWLP